VPSIAQRSFAGGEIAPAMYGRADQAKYATGARTLRNFMVQRFGGVTNRPGTKLVCEVKDSADQVALIPFEFNDEQTYCLEFGDEYMRVIRNGERLTVSGVSAWKAAVTITDATAADPVEITAASHGFSDGDQVVISGVAGMVELNGNTYTVANATANTFELEGIDGSGFTAYTSGGSANLLYEVADLVEQSGTYYYCIAEHSAQQPPNAAYWYALTGTIYEIPTPYAAADVADLKFVQSADVITLVHPTYAPRELARTGHTSWTLDEVAFEPSLDAPTEVAATGADGTDEHSWLVTAVADGTYEESLPGTATAGAATSISITGIRLKIGEELVVTTSGAHPFLTGQTVRITGVNGTSSLNRRSFIITKLTSTTFRLNNERYYVFSSRPSHFPYSSGGTATRTAADLSSITFPATITWSQVDGAREYNVYRRKNGIYGYIGTTTDLSFVDDGITPNLAETAPVETLPFSAADAYPAAVSLFQQRQLYANTNGRPETCWVSQVGSYRNLSARAPALDDDAFSFTVDGKKVHPIRHLVDIGRKLVLLSGGGAWTVQGDTDGVLRPTAINLHQEDGHGAANKPDPVVVGNSLLYVQARGSILRDLRYDFTSDGFPSRDLTMYAAHLFAGHSIVDMAYAEAPHSIIWAVRDDGALLGLTYVRDHEVWGWHVHETGDGDAFERVLSIPEGGEDAVYVVVRRTVDGSTKRYIERFASRQFEDVAEDAIFTDSTVTQDGRHTGATTMTLSGGTDWLHTETLTLTASAATFSSDWVGDQIRLSIDGQNDLRVSVTAYTDTTHVSVRAVRTVPAAFRGVAVATWARGRSTVTGLSHLEGREVAILADGYVCPAATVSGGAVSLGRPYFVAHVGLGYTADLETLDVDSVTSNEVLSDKRKRVSSVTVYLESSRGMWVGQDEDHQVEWKQRSAALAPDQLTPLFTGTMEQRIPTTWNDHGRLLFSQRDPLPLTILSVIPSVQIGG